AEPGRSGSVVNGPSVFVTVWLVCALPSAIGATGRDVRLVDAARRADARAVRTLLHDRVDVNSRDAEGSTALAWAVYADSAEIAALLIEAGADANAANEYGETPLSIACRNRSSALIDRLLTAGANPNAAKPNGETVLMTAVDAGSVDIVKRLVAAG